LRSYHDRCLTDRAWSILYAVNLNAVSFGQAKESHMSVELSEKGAQARRRHAQDLPRGDRSLPGRASRTPRWTRSPRRRRGRALLHYSAQGIGAGYLSESRLAVIPGERDDHARGRARRARSSSSCTPRRLGLRGGHELSRYVVIELMSRAFAPPRRRRWLAGHIVRLVTQGQENGELRRTWTRCA